MDGKAGGNAAGTHGPPAAATVEPTQAHAAANPGATPSKVTRPSRLSPSLVQNGSSPQQQGPPSPTAMQQQQPQQTAHAAPVQHTDATTTQHIQSQHVQKPSPAAGTAATAARPINAAATNTHSKDAAFENSTIGIPDAVSVDEYDDADSLLDQQHLPWYQTGRLWMVLVMAVSVMIVLAGLLVQLTVEHDQPPEYASWTRSRKAFPWLHFFSAFLPLFFALHCLCRKLYQMAEWTAIREELYFLRPLRTKIANLLFWIVILAWYQVCFEWVWCTEDDMCSGESYQKALHVVWKMLICVTLFSAANFIKCGLARLLAYQFYRTAHFLKVKEAIERELYLIRLSQARRTLVPTPPAVSPAPGTGTHNSMFFHGGVTGWLAEKGSMIWHRGSVVFQPRRRHSAAGEAAFAAPAHDGQHILHMPDDREADVTAVISTKNESTSVQGKQRQQQLQQLHQLQQQHTGHDAVAVDDGSALLPPVDPHSGGSRASSQQQLAHGSGSISSKSKHKPSAGVPPVHSREPSFEQFMATRVPSLFGPGQHAGSAGRIGSRTGQRASASTKGSGKSLANMVPGVDGLLLQPEVLEVTATAKKSLSGKTKPMTEGELLAMRKALGVNTFGAFVDRYYGLSAKEEAAHVRHVKRFAKGLFYNIKGEADRDFLLPSDFLLFFDGDGESADDAFRYFDRNGDGSISCTELQESAAEMLKERKNIAASIKDTDSVVDSLETGLGLLIHFIWLIFYLLVWGVNIVKGWTTFSTTVLALTFVFGDSVKSVFESALFLFLEHPYDVGDMLIMSGNVFAKVKKIDLMYTVMLQSSGEMVWHPNYLMRSAVLMNLSRSGTKWEGYSWLVDLDTPDEVLDTIQAAMKAHMVEHPQNFKGDPVATWRGLEEPFKIRLYVGWSYTFPGDDLRRTRLARLGMLKVIRGQLQSLGIKYTLPLTPAATPYLKPQTASAAAASFTK